MSNKIEFSECPCCNALKYGLLQDKVHLDWARECLACGFAIELMPRANSRVNYYSASTVDEEEFDAVHSGLRMAGGLEELFGDLSNT